MRQAALSDNVLGSHLAFQNASFSPRALLGDAMFVAVISLSALLAYVLAPGLLVAMTGLVVAVTAPARR